MEKKGELFVNELMQRDIIQDITNKEKVINALNNNHKLYVGFDPSASSIHLGNFVVVNILSLCVKYGIEYVIIVGGMTGMIGDPSGKKSERSLLDVAKVKQNVEDIKKQLSTLLPNSLIINNASFYEGKTIIDFLRDVGKYVNISYLLNKEIIKSRLESGISFTEFSYNLIQANDFYVLHEKYDVDVEIGGSDQWGNITIGIDYVNKKANLPESTSPMCGFTLKLLLKSDGTKFGKSEKGAVYLDGRVTSPYTMYQFLINQADDDCLKLLNFLSNYSVEEIKNIIEKTNEDKSQRYAQMMLAKNIIDRVHGKGVFEKLQSLSNLIFKNDVSNFSKEDVDFILTDFPITKHEFKEGESVVDLLLEAKVFESKNEIRTLVTQNGLSISGIKITDLDAKLSKDMIIHNRCIFVKKGKQDISIIAK